MLQIESAFFLMGMFRWYVNMLIRVGDSPTRAVRCLSDILSSRPQLLKHWIKQEPKK